MDDTHITPEVDRSWHKCRADCWCEPCPHEVCPECRTFPQAPDDCPICQGKGIIPIEGYVDHGINVVYVHNKNKDPKDYSGQWLITSVPKETSFDSGLQEV